MVLVGPLVSNPPLSDHRRLRTVPEAGAPSGASMGFSFIRPQE